MEIDELPTQMVTKTEGSFTWKVAATEPSNLEKLLNSKPDGTIVFVDCQNASGTYPEASSYRSSSKYQTLIFSLHLSIG